MVFRASLVANVCTYKSLMLKHKRNPNPTMKSSREQDIEMCLTKFHFAFRKNNSAGSRDSFLKWLC